MFNDRLLFRVALGCLATVMTGSLRADYLVSSGPNSGSGAVLRYDDAGNFLSEIGRGVLEHPTGIAMDAKGDLYVNDYMANEVRRFDVDDIDLGTFAQTDNPFGIILDPAGNVLVSEDTSGRIRKFDPNGTDLGDFADTGLSRGNQMAYDAAGNLYIASHNDQQINYYDPAGNFLGVFSDAAKSGIASVVGLAFDTDGNLYASDTFQNIITKLDSNGDFVSVFANTGMNQAEWLTFEPNGDLLVASFDTGKVRRFDSSGNDLGDFIDTGGEGAYQIIQFTPLPEIMPTSFNVFRGKQTGGNLASLFAKDGDRLIVRNGPIALPSEAPITVTFKAAAPVQNASILNFLVINRVSIGNLQMTLDLFDWTTNAYDQTITRAASTSYQTIKIRGTSVDRYIQAGTQSIQARVRVRPAGVLFTNNWNTQIDKAVWQYAP